MTFELAEACGTGPVRLTDDARIPLPGRTFDDCLATLPSKRRVSIRRERRAFTEAGYDVRTLRLSECADAAGALLTQLQQRHGHPAAPTAMSRLLRDQADGMADTGTVLACYAQDHIVTFSLFYRRAATVWLRATGYDAHGVTILHRGMESLHAKTLSEHSPPRCGPYESRESPRPC